MGAVKTIGYWITWLLWYGAACIPAALFGSTIAAAFYGFHGIHKPRTNDYLEGMYFWEAVGGIVSAIPGFIRVCAQQVRERRKEQAALHIGRPAGTDDASIWPPAPKA